MPNRSQRTAPGPRGFSFSFFAGVDRDILDRTPTERRFYETLGITVLAISLLSGIAMAVAAGMWLDEPAWHLAWLGAAWTTLMACGIEPLIYQTATSRRRHLPFIVVPRLALSLLLAIQIGEPMVIKINEDAIGAHIATVNARAARSEQNTNRGFFDREVARTRNQINGIKRKQRRLRANIARYDFLATCEAGTPACSTTGRPGCDVYCLRYKQLAADSRQRLADAVPVDRDRLAKLEHDAADLAARRDKIGNASADAIAADHGLAARERALHELMAADPAISREAWFWRLFLIAVDLTPLTIKVLRAATLRSPYEEMAAALREKDAVEAAVVRQQARVRVAQASSEADADIAIDAEEQRARAMDRIDAIWRRFRGERITPDDEVSDRRAA